MLCRISSNPPKQATAKTAQLNIFCNRLDAHALEIDGERERCATACALFYYFPLKPKNICLHKQRACELARRTALSPPETRTASKLRLSRVMRMPQTALLLSSFALCVSLTFSAPRQSAERSEEIGINTTEGSSRLTKIKAGVAIKT